MSPDGIMLPITSWRHTKGQNGTHRRSNQGFEAKGIAVSGERRLGALAGRVAERQDVLAVLLSLQRCRRKSDSRPIPGSDSEGGKGKARCSGRASRRWQVTRAGDQEGESRKCQQCNGPGVRQALFPRAGGEELEEPGPYPALPRQRNLSRSGR